MGRGQKKLRQLRGTMAATAASAAGLQRISGPLFWREAKTVILLSWQIGRGGDGAAGRRQRLHCRQLRGLAVAEEESGASGGRAAGIVLEMLSSKDW